MDYLPIIVILTAYLLDKILGDPASWPHPIIYFGRAIGWFEKKFNKGKYRIIRGAITSLFLIAAVFFAFLKAEQLLIETNNYVSALFQVIFIFFGLAGTTLIKEGKAVFIKLEESLDAGRQQVGRIVGRDTSQLTDQQVRLATLETLAENLSDGVIAPLFWYAIAGVPGIMTYKMINTLDSMIGYKSERYYEYGRIAAYIDDIANWIPARLTGILMAIVMGSKKAFIFMKKYGRSHSSPNAGYPESALAGILNTRFGGPNNYFGTLVDKPYIGENNRPIVYKDIEISVKTLQRSEFIMIVIITVASILRIAF